MGALATGALGVCALGAAAAAVSVGLELRSERQELRSLAGELHALQEELRQQEPTQAAAGPAVTSSHITVDSSMIQAVAATVAASLAHSSPAPTASADRGEPPPDERTAEQHAALARAEATLAGAMQRRKLTREDVTEMRQLTTSATPSELEALRSRISRSINADELVPEDPHFMMP
jgi:hypothetical protein